MIGLFGVLNGNAQSQDYEELSQIPTVKSYYLMPYGGMATHFSFRDDNVVSPSRNTLPTNVPDWNESLDNDRLIKSPTDQSVSPGPMLGLELGLAWTYENSDASVGKVYLGFAYEYQNREYSAAQHYHNGTVLGEYALQGREVKSIVRLQLNTVLDKLGMNVGIWYRISNVSDRTYTFNSYRDGDLEYTQLLHPTPITEDQERWKDSRGGMGFSIGMTYEPVNYIRLFARYEYSVIPTNVGDGIIFEPVFPSDGIRTHSIHFGVGIPILIHRRTLE